MSDHKNTVKYRVGEISNETSKLISTDKGEDITVALLHAKIPFRAEYGEDYLKLVYDKNQENKLQEILRKAKSNDYGEILLVIRDEKNKDGFRILLKEVADILHISESTLQARPIELQDALCRHYVNLWYSDDATIQRELRRMFAVNTAVEQDLAEQQRQITLANNTPEKRSNIDDNTFFHDQAVLQGQRDYAEKARLQQAEQRRTAHTTRRKQRQLAEALRRMYGEKQEELPQRELK